MITYPKNWIKIGQAIKIRQIQDIIIQILSELDCNSLSFSGGLDSSLMLYFMLRAHKQVQVFTMGVSEQHPDIKYSKLVVSKFDSIVHRIYIPSHEEIETVKSSLEDFKGDQAISLFYKFVGKYTDKIIACDGIDEFMCGYYAHQDNPCEDTYYAHIRQLRNKHLIPLDKNSEEVKVYLPFLDDRLLLLFSQIPISKKVDKSGRKKLLVKMAKDKIPDEIVNRRKYGFCDVLDIKE